MRERIVRDGPPPGSVLNCLQKGAMGSNEHLGSTRSRRPKGGTDGPEEEYADCD